ncbi:MULTISPECIES: hypothetical protein [Nocardia]|uniref:hypothetical protein n=1 Tax=Nocardia TaxID=1817 RepID=UPI0007A38DBA|nr:MULTISPECIES: hypothetical protein [Nocardia]
MSEELPGIPVVYSTTCSFCGGPFQEGEQVIKAFGWDQLEHWQCAGMGFSQMQEQILEILSHEEDS